MSSIASLAERCGACRSSDTPSLKPPWPLGPRPTREVMRASDASMFRPRATPSRVELANVQVWRRLAVEAADVVTPEGLAAGAQTQASAQGRDQVLIRGV